jgi:K+/H+ antiporter YhaU regulatory subunit KhtT
MLVAAVILRISSSEHSRARTTRSIPSDSIAAIVSAETIKTHVTNILGKLQAKDRTHAAVIGVRRGLVSGE